MPRTQSDKKKHAAYMKKYMQDRNKKDPDFHTKKKEYLKNYYRKKIEEIKKNPQEYEKYKKQNANKVKQNRIKLKNDPIKYEEYLKKDRAYQKLRMSKMSAEEKYEIWKRARLKYKTSEKGIAARIKWKQSEKSKEYDKKYRKEYLKDPKNREKLNRWLRKYQNERYHNDIEYRLRHRLSNVMRRAVRAQRTGKSKTTAKIVGCDFKFLIKHLESKFKKGMNWNNMGQWHIDHIKPCKSFDLTKKDEQERCFHYTNLQPLWALENIKKSAKISKEYNNDD